MLGVLFRENLNGTSELARLLAENSYAAYIFHYPIVLAVQFSLDSIVIFGAGGKFITVSILAVAMTYTISFWLRKLPYVNRVI